MAALFKSETWDARTRWLILIVVSVLTLAAFWPAYALVARSAIALAVLPILVGAVAFGWRGGLGVALLSVGLDTLLFLAVGEPDPRAFLGRNYVIAHGVFLLAGATAGIMADLRAALARELLERRSAEEAREILVQELTAALAQVDTLKGLLPICAGCKKVREDDGSWQEIEVFIAARSRADFSHGICPACEQHFYADLLEDPALSGQV